MATSPDTIKRFESNIPKVTHCCCFIEMNIGGTLMGIFGTVLGILYAGYSLSVLYSVESYLKSEVEQDDVMYNDDDYVWFIYISTLFVGLCLLVTSVYMLLGSSQATTKVYRQQYFCFQRMARHIFPFLIGILLSTFWTFVLGTIEVFDSDIKSVPLYFLTAFQAYLWVCAVSYYNQLLEIENNPCKPTRTDV